MAAPNAQFPLADLDGFMFPDGLNEELDASLFNSLDPFDGAKLAGLGVQNDANGQLQFDMSAFPGLDPNDVSQFMYGPYPGDPLYSAHPAAEIHKATDVITPSANTAAVTSVAGPESIASTSPSLHDSLQPFDLSPLADTPSSTSDREPASRSQHHRTLTDPGDGQDEDDGTVYGDRDGHGDLDADDGDADRENKPGPKKPGRKPLMSEPTTKRKAQNRAAQRAFRERKEKHLKDLETKVEELQKSSDATSQENQRLRAQVERLQVELREYRKRLSLSSSIVPINNATPGMPRFGPLGIDTQQKLTTPLDKVSTANSRKLPATNKLLLDRLAKATELSLANSLSESGTAQRRASSSSITGNPARRSVVHAAEDPARIFRFNSQTSPMTSFTSPGPSLSPAFGLSVSPKGTPPITQSTATTAPAPAPTSATTIHSSSGPAAVSSCPGGPHTGDGELDFCELLNMACGNRKNPIPRVMARSRPTSISSPSGAARSERLDSASPLDGSPIPWTSFSPPDRKAPFSPSLPDTVRASQILFGDNSFSNSVFGAGSSAGLNKTNDDLKFGGPINMVTNTTLTASPMSTAAVPSSMLAARVNADVDGDDEEVVPGEDTSNLMNCHTIWNKLKQRNIETESINMDELCSELRAKARCSENGVVVDQRDVDEALNKLPRR